MLDAKVADLVMHRVFHAVLRILSLNVFLVKLSSMIPNLTAHNS